MPSYPNQLGVLRAARQVADFASAQGVPLRYGARRDTYEHAGAMLADAVLQAGLNYRSVVQPRVARILKQFPDADRVSALICIVRKGSTANLLDWAHPTKPERFERLVIFLHGRGLDTTEQIRDALRSEAFGVDLQCVDGVGPKTVDYMACLVGIESIAVDRHIRSFAAQAGVLVDDYSFLKGAFCFAADLLSISRREFDSWIWSRQSQRESPQLGLMF